MNKDIFNGTWDKIEGEIKQAWGKLTDDDLLQIKGSQQEIYGRLQKHYGYSKEEAEKVVDDFRKWK